MGDDDAIRSSRRQERDLNGGRRESAEKWPGDSIGSLRGEVEGEIITKLACMKVKTT